jgi:predicted DNA-binding transcriptional regulator AlpA
MSDTALAAILQRLAAVEAALAPRLSAVDVSKQSGRPPDDEPQAADALPRQPRRVRAGLTRGPPKDELHEPVVDPANDRRLTKRQVAEREACSTRTIDRRVADGSFPAPNVIAGRLYWWLSALQRHERERSQSTTRTPCNAGKPRPRGRPHKQLAQPAREVARHERKCPQLAELLDEVK